jgi:hypothetical protein
MVLLVVGAVVVLAVIGVVLVIALVEIGARAVRRRRDGAQVSERWVKTFREKGR